MDRIDRIVLRTVLRRIRLVVRGLVWSIIDTWDEYNRHVIYRIEGRVPTRTGETT